MKTTAISDTADALLIQPPMVFEGADVIYPSLPCLGAALNEAGIPCDYINLNLEYQIAEKRRCLDACQSLSATSFFQAIVESGTGDFDSLRFSYWSDYFCSLVKNLGERVSVNRSASVVVDGCHSIDEFFAHVWKQHVISVTPQISIDVLNRTIGSFVSESPFTAYLNAQIDGWRLHDRKLVGITVPMVDNLGFALSLARALRTKEPALKIILGGTAFSAIADWVIDRFRSQAYIEAIVQGVGERAIVAAAIGGTLEEKSALSLPVVNKTNCDSNSLPTRRPGPRGVLTNSPAVRYPRPLGDDELSGEVTLLQSRGCYWGECVYCTYPDLYGPNDYRERPVETIVAEIKYHLATGYKRFRLANDTLREGYASDLAKGLLAEGLLVEWRSFMRAEPFKLTTLQLMKQSGGWGFILGLETVVDRLLRFVKKGVIRRSVETLFDGLAVCDLKVEVNAMPDLPTTTVDEALETLAFLEARKELICRLNVSPLVLPLGSPMAKAPEQFGLRVLDIPPKFVGDSTLIPFERTKGASSTEIAEVIPAFLDLADRIARAERARLARTHSVRGEKRPVNLEYSALGPNLAVSHSKLADLALSHCITYKIDTQEFHVVPLA